MCHFVLVFFSPFSIAIISLAIISLGEERANLSAFRTFVRFVLGLICRFPLPLGVWEGLRFVILHSLDFSLTFFALCFVLVFFSPFSIAITSLGEERANLSVLCTFVRFVFVWFCLFPLPLGLWLVIVARPELFSYLFLQWEDASHHHISYSIADKANMGEISNEFKNWHHRIFNHIVTSPWYCLKSICFASS